MLLLQILQLWPPFQFQKAKNRALDMSSSLCMFKTFFGFPSQIPDWDVNLLQRKGKTRLSHYNHPFPVYMEEEEKDFARLRTQIKKLLRACQISYNERKSTMLLSMYSLIILLDDVR